MEFTFIIQRPPFPGKLHSTFEDGI